MGSPHIHQSLKHLGESINSLLGSKIDLTVTWAESVKLIIEDLSVNSYPSSPSITYASDYKDEELTKSTEGLEGDLVVSKAAHALSTLNRKLALNKYLDLKGNIRVFCRVRPLLQNEQRARLGPKVTPETDEVKVETSGKLRSYKFDRVFLPVCLQDEIFAEVEPIIRSALDGYNVCIFAYGQTGTGKTFTMVVIIPKISVLIFVAMLSAAFEKGKFERKVDCLQEGTKGSPGIVPRTLQHLFYEVSLDKSIDYTFTISMLEVYKGYLQDLLVPNHNRMTDAQTKRLTIQMRSTGIEVENLTEVEITNVNQACRLYWKGSHARSTSWTTANETSSRSHCLFRITISSCYKRAGVKCLSKLWLIDLGGSERFFKTHANGQTLEEGKALNVSLSALGDVISALQKRQPHIPYRNSKLTQILRDCMGKNSKALMLVHVSPKEDDLGETLCSLGFASRARGIHLEKELSSMARQEKEAIMADVLSKMKVHEDECQRLNIKIQRLESALKEKRNYLGFHEQGNKLHDKDHIPLKTEDDGRPVISSNVAAGLHALPRFMTPTFSSRCKNRVPLDHLDSNWQDTGKRSGSTHMFVNYVSRKFLNKDLKFQMENLSSASLRAVLKSNQKMLKAEQNEEKQKTKNGSLTITRKTVPNTTEYKSKDRESAIRSEKKAGNKNQATMKNDRVAAFSPTTVNRIKESLLHGLSRNNDQVSSPTSSPRLRSERRDKHSTADSDKKSSKVRRRLTLECSRKISVEKRSP
ncbi:hypothetical protein O6H91_16G072400 [Diphasiastrum complanatum]|uniref:Uncharacterized protein n=1 Tax=Diphasiastrum complanatum TaxID=34168 RepID=A0ACC2BDR9_DIPCM|nr:hypothetical protein O6H91_16G072400 [Diphasiastrum complanatum]